jgi:hypothetical protein
VNLGRVDQRAGRFRRRLQGADDPFEARAVANRHVERHASGAKTLADVFQQLGKVDVVGVHARDDDHAADAGLLRLLEDAAGVDFDAAVGVDRDQGRIGSAKSADRLADEVGIARRVDDVEPLASVREVDDARFDRPLVGLFLGIEVADARAGIDARVAIDGARFDQQLVAQHGLATAAVAAKGNVADVSCARLRHSLGPFTRRAWGVSPMISRLTPAARQWFSI